MFNITMIWAWLLTDPIGQAEVTWGERAGKGVKP